MFLSCLPNASTQTLRFSVPTRVSPYMVSLLRKLLCLGVLTLCNPVVNDSTIGVEFYDAFTFA